MCAAQYSGVQPLSSLASKSTCILSTIAFTISSSWFCLLGAGRHAEDSRDNPLFVQILTNVVMGRFIILPWFLGLTDFDGGCGFVVTKLTSAPLRNARKNYELERRGLTMLFVFVVSLIATSTGHNWGLASPLISKEVPLARLPLSLGGLKVFLITDVHVGPNVSKDIVDSVVGQGNPL